jgi:hypothetical protein
LESRQAGRAAHKLIEPTADQRQSSHFEPAQHELRHESDQREVDSADHGQTSQDMLLRYSAVARPVECRHETAVLAKVVGYFFDVKNDRDVKEGKEDDQVRKINS